MFRNERYHVVHLGGLKENLKEQLAGASEYLADMKEDGRQKMINYFNSITDLMPVIAETGYRLKGINVEVSLPPGISMHFEKFKEISKEAIDEILARNADKEMLKTIVNSLVAADQVQQRLRVGDLTLSDISIEISLPPKVTIMFGKVH